MFSAAFLLGPPSPVLPFSPRPAIGNMVPIVISSDGPVGYAPSDVSSSRSESDEAVSGFTGSYSLIETTFEVENHEK